ncbi:Protein of unknown function [Gryllus bimaculatus]|nr:Protein of unknown function [Gryllus bimaculatus]
MDYPPAVLTRRVTSCPTLLAQRCGSCSTCACGSSSLMSSSATCRQHARGLNSGKLMRMEIKLCYFVVLLSKAHVIYYQLFKAFIENITSSHNLSNTNERFILRM